MTSPAGTYSSPAAASVSKHCVLWHPPNTELPGELLTSLSRNMSRMIVCTDLFAALAECCLIERHARLERVQGASPSVRGYLVIVQPGHLPDVPRLIESVRAYAPSITLGSYDRSANPKLRSFVQEDMAASSAPTLPHTAPFPSPAATPRSPAPAPRAAPPAAEAPALNGHHEPHDTLNGAPSAGRPRRVAAPLTEDELRMLLSPEPIMPIARPARPALHRAEGSGAQGGAGA